MTARCEPPSGAADGSWHWLETQGSQEPAEWASGAWHISGKLFTHKQVSDWGYRYLAPIPSPDAVRALVEAARALDEQTDSGCDYDRQLSICTCEYCQSARLLRAALAAFPAQPESKS